jgi:hypothetical protein
MELRDLSLGLGTSTAEALMSVPDFFTELIAWRKFDLRDAGRLLVSVNHPIPWGTVDPGPAFCIADSNLHGYDEECPAFRCSCGFYAYKTRDDAAMHAQGRILVRVMLWGRIAEHKRGYRAERIKLAEIFVPKDLPTIAALEKRYNIPVTVDEGAALWTSVNPSASSQSSLLQYQQLQALMQNQLQPIQNYNPYYGQQPQNYSQQYAGNILGSLGSVTSGAQIGSTIQVRVPQAYIPIPKVLATVGEAKKDPVPLIATTFKEALANIEKRREASMKGDE